MTKININGILTKTKDKCIHKQVYTLEVTRRSGTVDTLLVLSEKDDLPEGTVRIEGNLHASVSYIHSIKCVPVVIFPDVVEPDENNGYSMSEVIGTLKEKPKCRKIKNGLSLASVLIKTEDGPIPVLVWGDKAEEAEKNLKAGDLVKAEGRLQSRTYPDRKKEWHTTYELSSKGLIPVNE